MTTRPWKVEATFSDDSKIRRSYGSGERAFDAAEWLKWFADRADIKVKNVETGEIWSWDDAASPTPAS